MERAAYFKQKAQKLEQLLSLPRIEEYSNLPLPQTSAKSHRTRPTVLQATSEGPSSPEEEHLHEQIRLLFHQPRRTPTSTRRKLKSHGSDENTGQPTKRKALPSIGTSQQKSTGRILSSKTSNRAVRSQRHLDIDKILQNQDRFISSYFVELRQKRKRTAGLP